MRRAARGGHGELVSRNLPRLLGGHLKGSGGGWLCACLAVQFLTTSATWALRNQNEFLPGILLLAIAATQSSPGRGLAWRTLPISPRELALANWWAVTALPGLALSLALLLVLPSNHSEGWSVPSTASVALQIAGVWSALGYIAWLPVRLRSHTGYRGMPLVLLSWVIPLLAAFHGYPLGPTARNFSIAAMAAGCVLVLLSFLRARSGLTMPGVAASPIPAPHDTSARSRSVAPGWSRALSGAAAQAAMMLGLGLGGACLLRHFYPHATEALLWAFLAGMATWSVLAARRWTRSLWCWRCLPLTSRRMTLAVQAVQLLPLSTTMLAAWAMGRLAPHLSLPVPGWLAVATVAVVAIGDVQARSARRWHESSGIRYWAACLFALTYLSVLPGIQLAAGQVHWLPLLTWIGAALVLMASFNLTLTQMRSPEHDRTPSVQRD